MLVIERDGSPEVVASDLEGKLYVWSTSGERLLTRESRSEFSGKPLAPFDGGAEAPRYENGEGRRRRRRGGRGRSRGEREERGPRETHETRETHDAHEAHEPHETHEARESASPHESSSRDCAPAVTGARSTGTARNSSSIGRIEPATT